MGEGLSRFGMPVAAARQTPGRVQAEVQAIVRKTNSPSYGLAIREGGKSQ
jgi:hypothetical protein